MDEASSCNVPPTVRVAHPPKRLNFMEHFDLSLSNGVEILLSKHQFLKLTLLEKTEIRSVVRLQTIKKNA